MRQPHIKIFKGLSQHRFLSTLLALSLVAFSLLLPVNAEDKPLSSTNAVMRGVDGLPLEQRRAFLRGTLSDWRINTDMRRGKKPPPIQKSYSPDAVRLDLVAPDKFAIGSLSVRDAIRNRRSRREFSAAPFSLEELSYLLWATQGISKIDRDQSGGVIAQFRTVPSGGARHPFETYLFVNRVEGVKPGLYRYLPVEHQLLVIGEYPNLGKQVTAACYGQGFIGSSAVTFVWTAIPYRTEWKYGTIAEKLVAIEVGHLCQNLYLAIESIHSGVCSAMSYDQSRMDALLGVDGRDEFAIYLAAAGKPIEETDAPSAKMRR